MLFHFQLNNPIWPDAQPCANYLLAFGAGVIVWLTRHTIFQSDTGVSEAHVPRQDGTAQASRPAGVTHGYDGGGGWRVG